MAIANNLSIKKAKRQLWLLRQISRPLSLKCGLNFKLNWLAWRNVIKKATLVF